jgi:hypothetical protein
MTSADADLEFGLVWDAGEAGFDVSMRYSSMRYSGESGQDRLANPHKPVCIDLAALERLVDDPAENGAAQTRMVFEPDEIKHHLQAIAVAQERCGHLRVHSQAVYQWQRKDRRSAYLLTAAQLETAPPPTVHALTPSEREFLRRSTRTPACNGASGNSRWCPFLP